MKVLLTGGTGFVGTSLLRSLNLAGHEVVVAVRSGMSARASESADCAGLFRYPGLEFEVDWAFALADVDVVVHVAARAHVLTSEGGEGLSLFHKINVDGTLALACQAAACGVKRFIFVSSIKAMGESSEPGQPFCAEGALQGSDPYGLSKRMAEEGLISLAAETTMELVIVRPVLVYGPGVGANFLRMMQWLAKGVPLPLGAIYNKRSLLALDNLVDLIVTCIDHPAAANQTFLVSDGEDLSTTELLSRMAKALGQSARLLPLPGWMLESSAKLLGKQALAQRLCGSLQVDITKTRELLGWEPPVSVDEALRRTAEHFIVTHQDSRG